MSTSSDKTKDKLVASMRKTKEGANEPTQVAAATPAPAAEEKKPEPAKKAAAPKKKPAAKKAKAKSASDSFQSPRRVWPD